MLVRNSFSVLAVNKKQTEDMDGSLQVTSNSSSRLASTAGNKVTDNNKVEIRDLTDTYPKAHESEKYQSAQHSVQLAGDPTISSITSGNVMSIPNDDMETENVDSDIDVVGDDDDDYSPVRNKRKRLNLDENFSRPPVKTQNPMRNQTARTVYIKGKNYNLAKSLEMKNIRSFKRELLQEIGEPEKIDCKGDSVRITCYTELQKQRLLATTHIDNKGGHSKSAMESLKAKDITRGTAKQNMAKRCHKGNLTRYHHR